MIVVMRSICEAGGAGRPGKFANLLTGPNKPLVLFGVSIYKGLVVRPVD